MDIGFDFRLFHNYPNPCVQVTKIPFEILNRGYVQIKLLNFVGAEMLTLTDEYYFPGRYTLTMDRNSMEPGIYFIQMTVNDRQQMKRLIIL